MAARIPILAFHDIAGHPSVISIQPEVFRRGMARLYEHGYRTLGLLEAVDCLRRGAPFPDRSVVITFDDGYQSVYDMAFPVLQRYGMSATVFLAVGEKGTPEHAQRLPSFEGRTMLAWREILEMHRWGISFGAHTLSHCDLTHEPTGRIEAEIRGSKATLEEGLGAPIACFAYPFGRHDRRSREIVKHHFTCACSVRLGLVTASSNPYALERVDAYYLRTDRLFDIMLTRLFPWYLRARGVPRSIRRALHRKRWTDRFASA